MRAQRHTRAGAGMSASAFMAGFSSGARVSTPPLKDTTPEVIAALHRLSKSPAPVASEVSTVTRDGRPCLLRYVSGGDVVSVWVPRFGDRPSESLDRLALVAREWMPWARDEMAKAERVRS